MLSPKLKKQTTDPTRKIFSLGAPVLMGALATLSLAGCGSDDGSDSASTLEELTCDASKAAGDYCGAALVQTLASSSDASLSTASSFTAGAGGRAATYGIKEYSFRYKTQIKPNGNTQEIDATGVLLIPDGTAPASGFPILMWAHGAVGGADACAPSSDSVAALESTVRHYAARGFVVIAPDYAGLGVDGVPHYFLVKEPTAYSVLDGIEATIRYAEANNIAVDTSKVVMLGLSQGGQAVLFAHEYYDGSQDYRRTDFTVVGSAALAPAPAWKNALFAAQVYATALPGSLAAFAASYLHSASLYNSSLDTATLLSAADKTAVSTYYESMCTAELATGKFSTTLSNFATSGMQSVVGLAFAGFACYLTGDTGNSGSGIPANMCTALNSAGIGASGSQGSVTSYPNAILSASGSSAWAAQMQADSPGSGLTGGNATSIPIRIIQGMMDTTVAPQMTVPLMHEMLGNGNNLVSASNASIASSFAAAALGPLASCSSSTDLISCSAGHSGATGILNEFSMYSDWVFDRAGL